VLRYAGVPIIPASSQRMRGRESKPHLQESSPFTGFYGGLCWGIVSPAERREGFPSWSWTGWRSKIRWEIKGWEWHLLEPNKDLQLSIQLVDGKVVDLETLCHAYDEMSMKISDTLHIATWTFPLRIWRSWIFRSTFEYEAIVELEDKEPSLWWFVPTCTTPILPNTKCTGIHLCHTTEGETVRSLYVLVLREVENGVYERVGFGTMDGNMRTVSEDRRMGLGIQNDDELRPILEYWLPPPAPRKVWKEFQLR
jgi:hypothetical protein